VVLKPLDANGEAAETSAERVWGVIHGTAVNQDGRTSTLTAPNGPAQERVIRLALERAGVGAGAVGYLEAHGTGTPLGDPQEALALANVFGADRGEDQPLVVGAAKSNVGHLEMAAGMVGLVKAVLCLRHGEVPPNIHCERLNPRLEGALERCAMTFPRGGGVKIGGRHAGVSSFGFGGTNSHVVVVGAVSALNSEEGAARPKGVEGGLELEWHRVALPWGMVRHPLIGTCERKRNLIMWIFSSACSIRSMFSSLCHTLSTSTSPLPLSTSSFHLYIILFYFGNAVDSMD
jgi:acyl transferase domain-containing protein